MTEPVNVPTPSEGKRRTECWCIYDHVWIEFDGTVLTCCNLGRKVAGNVRTESFYKIWNNEVFQTLRRQFKEGNPPPGCQGCPELRISFEKVNDG